MRHSKFTTPLLMTASFALGGVVVAQLTDAPPRIYIVDYMKVEPGAEENYVETELEWWKPVHAERIRRGSMRAWSLYRVRYPDGTAKPYDFVTVNVFDTFEDSDQDPFALLTEVHADANRETIEQQTLASRRLVRGEMWYRIDHLE